MKSIIYLILIPSFLTANSCFNEIKQNIKNSVIIKAMTDEMGDIVEEELEDQDIKVISISSSGFSFRLDHNNYNRFRFGNISNKFGKVKFEDDSGQVSEYYFNPKSWFIVEAEKSRDGTDCLVYARDNNKIEIDLNNSAGTMVDSFSKKFMVSVQID